MTDCKPESPDARITSLPKVIWEEGRVAAKVSHGAVW